MNSSADSSFFVKDLFNSCMSSTKGSYIYSAWFGLCLLLSPLFLLVLYIGLTKWRKQRNSAAVNVSHCDVFTFHMMALELFMTFGVGLFVSGVHRRHYGTAASGTGMACFASCGLSAFHALTCGERYLAVVHPITYLRLKRRGGVMVRNMCIAGAWLLSIIYMTVSVLPRYWPLVITNFLAMVIVLVTVTFFSVSVLCVLIRPKPGEGGGNGKRMDQSKRSALTTIAVILGVMLMRFGQVTVMGVVYVFEMADLCAVASSLMWFIFPSSLVSPLLFLQRSGKLPTCG